METYLVGGAVRDELLGLPVKERDFVVVGATPEQMKTAGFLQVGRDFPVFLHPETREEHALARTERKTGPGHRGFEVHASPEVTLEEDLVRRDLTINAIAKRRDGTLIDPCGGCRDIDARLLRHVSGAFTEDPLRILRIARFRARLHHLGFEVAPETLALLEDMVSQHMLEELSPDRIIGELDKALETPDPVCFFELLARIGAGDVLWPELKPADIERLNSNDPGEAEARF
ncbi:MAG: multifunctional CCA tRNA nucleotidyl transferase/2'3'-cyclic phosphodiesterase/2'nucleotidase/phosphatase, partial [Proteobacteria bacterium]|nr:multifunctional CCA tRNA nucleotidyl transferase/2'3'-cyclic phosphodiesterase/2'nucleotidase/phosphatase [Pseudomonadota bacterium]